MTTRFSGFPADAFRFYADLELDNTKTFWADNKHRYEAAVAGPMSALLEDLEAEFGTGRLFRPYRDVRFSADKSPYKEHQGGYVEVGPACGYYVQVSSGGADGRGRVVRVHRRAGGPVPGHHRGRTHGQGPAQGARGLTRAGMEVGGEQVRTRPRGVPADHRDLDLLRHRTVLVSATFPYDEPWLGTRTAGTKVRTAWRKSRPLVEWLADNVTGRGED